MIHSQICITSNNNRFKYHVEYQDDTQFTDNIYKYSAERGQHCEFTSEHHSNVIRRDNQWYPLSLDSAPVLVNESSINIYFPQYSVETYSKGSLYIVSAYTYVNGVRVQLCSYLIDRRQSRATSSSVKFKGIDYHEVINVRFPDPWYLCYDDNWKSWRDHLTGRNYLDETNNEGSIIYIELTPVNPHVDDNQDCWIDKKGYNGGSGCIPFTSNVDDLMHVSCVPVVVKKQAPTIVTELKFNKIYGKDIKTYLRETYGWTRQDLDRFTGRFDLVIGCEDYIYKLLQFNLGELDMTTSHAFTKEDLDITDWSGWRPGLSLIGSFVVSDGGEDIFSVISKTYPLTMEVFKYFIKTGLSKTVDFLNLDYIHMQSYNVSVVNKINKQIIKVNKPDDYKANILKPIFVRTYELNDLSVHPEVLENVCVDLNGYKQKVSTFYLKIEGVEFVEIGRTPSGVVFQINGGNLPNEHPQGKYYILNENHELVTTGNYTYIQ